jgi:hypothetical protein
MKTKDKVLGAGLGLAALAAAGTYFLAGKRGAKNREKIAGWVTQLKEEVLEKARALKTGNQKAYDALVEETVERLSRAQRVTAAEAAHIAGELKSAWTHVSAQLKSDAR